MPTPSVLEEFAAEVCDAAETQSNALRRAFAEVPRHKFLGPGPWKIAESVSMSPPYASQYVLSESADPKHVYVDRSIALIANSDLNNGHPSTVARWISALDIGPGDRVFHVGCGTGYYSAILSQLTGHRGRVLAIESEPDLAKRAKRNLANYPNVTVIRGDAVRHDPGTTDAILVSAGAARIPPLWLRSLAMGGRLTIPMTIGDAPEKPGVGVVIRCERTSEAIRLSVVQEFALVYPCPPLQDAPSVGQLEAAMLRASIQNARTIRLDRHDPDETCWLHLDDVCLSTRDSLKPSS